MKSSVGHSIIKVNGSTPTTEMDMLTVEEPLEIRMRYGSPFTIKNLAVTMRTPGHDAELALGFLFTEGIIADPSCVKNIDHVTAGCSINDGNIIMVSLQENITPNILNADRNFYTTSSCGVCGKASINAIRVLRLPQVQSWQHPPIAIDILNGLPGKVSNRQTVFAETGGLHAATLFNEHGKLLLLREDVGRHNAVDKLVGKALADKNINLAHCILLLSGRASFELVQKAAMAGIAVIAAIGAPSSLAVSLAEEFGITLIGFLRNNRFNIYSAAHRIQIPVYENTH